MGAARKRVEKQIGKTITGEAFREWQVGGEHQAVATDFVTLSFAPQVAGDRVALRQQPQYAVRYRAQDTHPSDEGRRIDFVAAVERAEHKSGLRPAEFVREKRPSMSGPVRSLIW